MATFNKFNSFVEALAKKQHNLSTDALKVMLSNAAPVATNAIPGNITEIGTGNGYAAGGAAVTTVSAVQTGGIFKLIVNDPTITAAGGAIGPFRYAVLYNSTAGLLIGWYDYGSALTLTDTDSLLLDFDGANGVLTIA